MHNNICLLILINHTEELHNYYFLKCTYSQWQLWLCRFRWKRCNFPHSPRYVGSGDSSVVRDPGHSAKSAGGRLQLNTNAPYVCGFAWSDMVHGCMVYTERTETAAVSCGTSHASAVSTPLGWIFKNELQKPIRSCRITRERRQSARWAENSAV